MKKLYLVGIGVVFLFILIMALPQVAATCSWYKPFSTSTNPTVALFQAAGLGAILGGLCVLYWKASKEAAEWDKEEAGSEQTPSKPQGGA